MNPTRLSFARAVTGTSRASELRTREGASTEARSRATASETTTTNKGARLHRSPESGDDDDDANDNSSLSDPRSHRPQHVASGVDLEMDLGEGGNATKPRGECTRAGGRRPLAGWPSPNWQLGGAGVQPAAFRCAKAANALATRGRLARVLSAAVSSHTARLGSNKVRPTSCASFSSVQPSSASGCR